MNISDNILKEQLKNVYFLSGGAYGGKTTMAKLIEKKYGFARYRQGDHYNEHVTFAKREFQPAMCIDRSNWHEFFARSPKQYGQWMRDDLAEQSEFAIIDLIKLSQNQKVIADVGISPDVLRRISDDSRVILLFAPEEMTRKHYFDREDKQDVYQFILSFPDGDKLLKNVVEALHFNSAEVRRSYYDSGFYCIERREDDTIEKTLKKIEKHFNLA